MLNIATHNNENINKHMHEDNIYACMGPQDALADHVFEQLCEINSAHQN